MDVDEAIVVRRLRKLASDGDPNALGQLCKSSFLSLSILGKCTDIPWDFRHLSSNASVTPDFVREHLEKPWDWKRLSWQGGEFLTAPDLCAMDATERIDASQISYEYVLHDLPTDIILRYRNLPWDWYALTLRSDIEVDFIIAHRELPWDWHALSMKYSKRENVRLKFSHVVNNLWIPWRWDIISRRNDVVTFQDVLDNLHLAWCWSRLSCNTNVTENVVDQYPSLPWDYEFLTRNPRISFEYIKKHKDKAWDIVFLSEHKGRDFQETVQDFQWHWAIVSRNTNLTLQFVLDHLDLPWRWEFLSVNCGIFLQDMLKHKELPWNWSLASMRSDVTEAIVEQNLDVAWSWSLLTDNQKITCAFVARHSTKPWQWQHIMLKKQMSYEFYEKFKGMLPPTASIACHNACVFLRVTESDRWAYGREHMAAWRIQQAWLRAYYNPEYSVCCKRLKRDCIDMQETLSSYAIKL